MLNNSGPRYKRSKIEKHINTHIFFCIGLLFFLCLIGAIGKGCSEKTTMDQQTSLSGFPHPQNRAEGKESQTYPPEQDTQKLKMQVDIMFSKIIFHSTVQEKLTPLGSVLA